VHTFIVLGLAVVCLAAAWVYIGLRPGLGKIKDGLNALAAYGRDQAEIRFIHRSGRGIVFRKEMVGGVQQILLVTQRLNLSPDEEVTVREFLQTHDLKIETRKKSKRAKSTKVVVLGHSVQKATDITTKLAKEILNVSAFARFRFDFEGLDFPSRR
jgi:hypothetical protein